MCKNDLSDTEENDAVSPSLDSRTLVLSNKGSVSTVLSYIGKWQYEQINILPTCLVNFQSTSSQVCEMIIDSYFVRKLPTGR